MAITFLDEEEDIVATAEPQKGGSRITFLDEEAPVEAPVSKRPKITFLDEEPAVAAQPEQPTPPVGTSIGAEIAAIPQAFVQGIEQPTEAMGETAEVLGMPSLGATLRGAIEAPEGYVSAAQRFMQPQEGEFQIGGFAPQFLPRAIVEQAGQIAGAIATRAAGAAIGGLAGSAVGPKGTVAGAVAGQFLGPALFEMSQIVGPVARERAANQGRETPNGDDLGWAWATAGASGALNAIGARYLPNGDKLAGGLAKRISQSFIGEGIPEGGQAAVQQIGETFLTEQGLDLRPKEIAGEALIGGGAGAAAVGVAAPFTKASTAAETKVVAEQAAPVAPETAQVVSEQANQVIAEAQAEETAETPDETIARLQREAQEAAGDIELEEEVSGLPPQPVTPTPEAPPVEPVAPVEPVVPAEGAVEPTVTEVAPTRNLADLEVRPPTDNVQQVAAANDLTVGRANVNIPAQELESTVNLSDPKERERVDNLKEQISSDGGFISRVIVDGQNNVVEGQHRVQAMKELGYDQIPAVQLKSAEDFIPDSNALDKVMQDAGLTASDNRTQMRQLIAEIISDEKGDVTQLREYEAPAGFETAWNAATEEVIRQNAVPEATPAAVEPTPVAPPPVAPEVPTAETLPENWQSLKIQDKASWLSGQVAGTVVGSAAREGQANDIDIRVEETQAPDAVAKLQQLGYETAGESLVSPEEAQQAGKDFGGQWARSRRMLRYENGRLVDQVDIWSPDTTPEITPQLEPLRRVVRAEQTEEDVAGLVDAGFAEVYKGQPVITQAGLDALPEAERPRLTPEARKIQIDTRTSEAAAEAISKNLRIGVDQVPVDVRMPAGWTLEGDIYVPPQPQAVTPAPTPEVREARREPAITPQQDRDYLAAVEGGDLDAASRMVEDAAKKAGYTFGPVWHGTRKEFTRFFSQPTYFSESEQFAKYTVAGKQGRVIKAYLRGNLFDPRNPEHRAQASEMERLYGKLPKNPTYQYFNAAVQNWLQENGWDGHYEQESATSRYRSLVVFDPMANAKSADPVTYDDQGNIIPLSQRFQPKEADIRYARREPAVPRERFYSQLQRTVEAKMPNVSSPEQLKAIIDPTRGSGVKPEEVKWSGITEAIDRIAAENNGRVPKEAVLKYLQDEGRIQFEPVTFSEKVEITPEQSRQIQEEADRVWEQWVDEAVEEAEERGMTRRMEVDRTDVSNNLNRSWDEAEAEAMRILGISDEPQTTYQEYQLPNGENYREVVLTAKLEARPREIPITSLPEGWTVEQRRDGRWRVLTPEGRVRLSGMDSREEAIEFTVESLRSEQRQRERRGGYTSPHFKNVSNYIAHYRANDRQDAKGRDGTFIEEIQSDLHQKAREVGYKDDSAVTQSFVSWLDANRKKLSEEEIQTQFKTKIGEEVQQWLKEQEVAAKNASAVPNTPFKKDWPLQIFKRALEEAVISGKEWIGWTTGETQASRYDLSKRISRIGFEPNEAMDFSLGELYAYDLDDKLVIRERDIAPEKLPEYVGKEAAEKMLQQIERIKYDRSQWSVEPDPDEAGKFVIYDPNGDFLFGTSGEVLSFGSQKTAEQYVDELVAKDNKAELSGLDLKVGGEGMVGFYDNILPKEIAKYVKKWGATVEKSSIPIKGVQAWAFFDRDGVFRVRDKRDGRDPDAKILGEFDNQEDAIDFAASYSGDGTPIWRVNITPEMRRIIQEEGQAVFLRRLRGEPMVGMETSAVEARLQELGFPSGGIIRVVNEPDADFEGRTIILDGKVTGIELNAAAMRDNATIDRVLNHEFAESANSDGALNKLVERLTPKEKKEINDTITRLRYEERARTSEEAARAIETLAEAWKGRGFFTRAVARVEAWASKLGFKLTRRAAEYIAARNLADINSGFKTAYSQSINVTTEAGQEIRASRREPEAIPTFTEGTPEAATLKEMEASMAKVDAASEAKGGKPETYKISEIASVWMDSGLGERELQDAIVEYTNLTPANAARVAKAINKQYGIQQRLAEAAAPLAEIAPEPEGAPRKSAVTKLIEQTTGVRKPVVKLQVSESAALKKQIQLKAREARETRKARKEAAEDLAKAITDYVKENPIRGPINSRQAMSITKRALKLDVNNEAAVDRFEMYVERVIENANYDRDLADARALIKRAKTLAKGKDVQGNVKTTLEAIANISPTLLDNPFEFNLVVQRYLLGLAPVTAKQYAVMPDADVRRYLESLETQIKDNQEILDRAKAQRILDKQAAYAEEKGIPLDEAISILNSEEFLQEKTIEKLEDLTKLLTAMAQESQKDVKAYDDSGATPKQKELISFMRKVNIDSLINEEKKRYIRFANNLLANGATFGMEQFQSIALGQEAAMKAAKDKRLSNKLAAWISPIGGDKAIDTARRIALRTQSEADTFKNIFGREAVGSFRNILGLNRLDSAQTDSNRAKEQIANEFGEYFKGLRKKYGDDATGFEAKGYAGIAGYLIQTDGNKTEAESIPYRRRLMEQNIAELRKSDKQSDLAEADLKERALAQLTGTTNAEILSQLQALNPASYEQLMWVKDVMLPKWRDFLKEHDENFRNQANNYNNPDHLTITYKFPEGQLLPNEIEDVYQQDMVGMRIKQAANSIKRKDHPNLPVSKAGTVANIDINFGYNQYNALVDQVDKAFVAPAWEQIVAFTKAPEFEQIMGGRANALFVKKLLVDIQTSRTRQSMTDDEAQLVAGGVRLARKISTQAVLGGFTQPLRQVPDQLSKLFFTTGRWDLITKNLLKIAEAAPLMNKFPIGRRGDAQAGTQYASQFSELARKVEASVTDRKWAKYRELMNKVGEFWMTPLRGSDVWAAKVSWMTYYEAYLNKQDIKMESWEREAELVDTDQTRKDAASYAEWAVDFYGGASDPTKMASLSKQTNNGWKEFAKLMFLPLNSFALQQKNSLISDLRDAYLRTGDRKASIAAVAGTLAGMASFHAMRIYIIGGLIYPAGKALLMGIFGIDMDEPDEEEKQKKLEDDWRKFKASMYGNIIAGGAGQFVEQSAIDAVNKATYLIQANVNPDELLNDKGDVMSFRQYEKDMSPLYRFRSFGTSEYSFGLADVLTEQAQRSLVETQQLLTPEEMERYTGNEQAYAMFSTMVEWLYFFRLMDTDATRIARDLKRQMDKQVEEREAEIRAIRSGR